MPRLVLSLLGSFWGTLDGRSITSFESDKARALLAYLAVESDRPHSREKLAGLLWPESLESAARASLSEAVSNLRAILHDRDASPPFLLVSRQAIQFNRESDSLVDVLAFAEGSASKDLTTPRDLSRVESALGLYRGRFLEGFSLHGCAEFEEWLLLEQEHLHRLALEGLTCLVAAHERQGQLDRALTLAWRQLELDPWRETAHVQAMRLLAVSGRRDAALAQYQACCHMLAEELDAEPSPETTRLYEQIRRGQLRAPPAPLPEFQEPVPPSPGFITGQASQLSSPGRQAFVARESELVWLDRLLDKAISGCGQAAFVIGGPGRGKTALLQEFARRALDAHPDLLVAFGTCNAYSGTGDPYLPFRGVLAMLTGEAEPAWAAGILSAGQAQRLWDALPDTTPIVARWGSGLVGSLLPARDLLWRARAVAGRADPLSNIARSPVPPGSDWLAQVEWLADPHANQPGGLVQSHLFEQYANVLVNLSAKHTLVLVLDDLQWADSASLGLLLHLARRLSAGHILLAGAYRPHELAMGRGGQRHPLEPVLAEYRARFDNPWLDLASADEIHGQQFLDQFLDTEPNALDRRFRDGLFARTRGHALFTVEILRAMQQRGNLVLDEAGRWISATVAEWEELPGRVEAVIAERVDRLPDELRDLLTIASVEGEEFTAQTLALVMGASDELQVLRALRGQLGARHRLVHEQGEVRLDARSLTRYRFSHFLVQQHVYESLGEAERRLLHQRVGEALEQLYVGRLEEVAVQLVRHFAGDPERERRYARLAGERSAAQYANAEAVRYLSRALELTPGDDLRERADVHYWLGTAHLAMDCCLEATEHLQAALGHARQAADRRIEALALAQLGGIRSRFMQDYTGAEALLRESVRLAWEAKDKKTEAFAKRTLAWTLCNRERYVEAKVLAEAVASLSEQAGIRQEAAWAHLILGEVARAEGDSVQAQRHYQELIAMSETDRTLTWFSLASLSELALTRQAFREARVYADQSMTVAEKCGHRLGAAGARFLLGVIAAGENNMSEAQKCFEQHNAVNEEIGALANAACGRARLGYVLIRQGDYEAGWDQIRLALRFTRTGDYAAQVCDALCCVAKASVQTGHLDRAAELMGLILPVPPSLRMLEPWLEPERGTLEATLGAEELQAALVRGAALNVDQVVAEILACETAEAYWNSKPERDAAAGTGELL